MCQSEEVVIGVAPLPQRFESAYGYVLGDILPFAGDDVLEYVFKGFASGLVIVAEVAVRIAVLVVIEDLFFSGLGADRLRILVAFASVQA